eukprot:scaffold4172_cov212-Alexandrium_tamarense.AAC.3
MDGRCGFTYKYSMLIAYRNSHILLRHISMYSNTEVLRDLTDEYRYNLLVPVANSLGIDPNTKPGEAPLWKDEAMMVLSKAIVHSFKKAKMSIIDQHALIDLALVRQRDQP